MDLRELTLSRRAALLAAAGASVAAAAAAMSRARHTGPAEGPAAEAGGQGGSASPAAEAGGRVRPAGSGATDPAELRRAYGPAEEALASSLSAVPWTSEGGAVTLALTGERFTVADASGTRTGAYVLSGAETRTETGEGNVTARITDFTVRTAGGTFPGELQEVTGPEGGTATSLVCGAFGDSAFSADWGAL